LQREVKTLQCRGEKSNSYYNEQALGDKRRRKKSLLTADRTRLGVSDQLMMRGGIGEKEKEKKYL